MTRTALDALGRINRCEPAPERKRTVAAWAMCLWAAAVFAAGCAGSKPIVAALCVLGWLTSLAAYGFRTQRPTDTEAQCLTYAQKKERA